MGRLTEHAEREMRLAGLYDEDADYGATIPDAVMELVRTFEGKGHSGGSAMMTLAVLDRVLKYQILSPITDDPADWTDVTEAAGRPMWQSTRDPAVFSEDGGATWYRAFPEGADPGDRVYDGGVLGTLVICPQCGGTGNLHAVDEVPETTEPDDGE